MSLVSDKEGSCSEGDNWRYIIEGGGVWKVTNCNIFMRLYDSCTALHLTRPEVDISSGYKMLYCRYL